MVEFYPILPSGSNFTDALERLPSLLQHPQVSALRLCCATYPTRQELIGFGRLCQTYEVALVLAPENPVILDEKNLKTQEILAMIDGMHLPYNKGLARELAQIRKGKPDIQTGCSVTNLDDAMHAGEAGIDYIALPATAREALAQWHAMAELPAIAELSPALLPALLEDHSSKVADLKTILRQAAEAGADFLAFPLQLTGQDAEFLDV